MPSNFKKLVRARMAATGESWQPAARAVRAQGVQPPRGSGDALLGAIDDAREKLAAAGERVDSKAWADEDDEP